MTTIIIVIGIIFVIASIVVPKIESIKDSKNSVNPQKIIDQIPSQPDEKSDFNKLQNSPLKIDNNKKRDTFFNFGNDDISLLWDASEKGDLATVESILNNKNIDINKRNKDGMTALHIASKAGHTDIVKKLLAAGAYIYAGSINDSPLSLASGAGHLDIVQILLDDAKPENIYWDRDDTITFFKAEAIKRAIISQHLDIIKLLTQEKYGGLKNLIQTSKF